MAARPGDGVLVRVLSRRRNPPGDWSPSIPIRASRRSIGVLTNQISSLAFRANGTLWAVSGDGGSPAETLYTVNTSNAALTLQFALGNGADGETIAFHGNGLMYHSSGNGSADVRKRQRRYTSSHTDRHSLGEMFAMGYNPTNGQLYGSDIASDLFTIDIATGARTPIGFINGPNDNRGLAFVSGACPSPTPTPTATATATSTPTATATATFTPTPTATATFTPTPTATATATATATPTATPTATASCTPNYAFTSGTGAIVPGVTDTGNHCDDCSTVISLPFPVTIYGTIYNSAAVGSNGHFTFGTVNNGFTLSCMPVSSGTDVLAPYWRDQRTDAVGGCTGCGIFTTTTGTAPNRIFRVEYRTTYFGQTSSTPTLNYEVNLYESGTPVFDFTYGLVTTFSATGRFLTVGVEKDTTVFTEFGCDPTGGTNPPVSTGQQLTASLQSCGSPTPTPTATAHTRRRLLHPVARLAGLRVRPSRHLACALLASISRPTESFMRWAAALPTRRAATSRTHLNMIRALTVGPRRQLPTLTTR